MKDFSLKTGDKFVHQKTAGIYAFDGLSFSTKTNNAEVSYRNTINESFTRDMGEFFGYTEDKKKRFLPLDEYLKENEDRCVVVSEDRISGEEELISIIQVLEVNGNQYAVFSLEKDEVSNNEEDIIVNVGRLSENHKYQTIDPIEDDEEFNKVTVAVDAFLDKLNEN